jgi:protein-S-isoprenylcysteine O-methyltransferase Ste14
MSFVLILASFALFAVVHSLLAGAGLKQRLTGLVGVRAVEGWYRLGYNIFAMLTLLPSLALLALLPDSVLYRVPWPFSLPLLVMQAAGAIGLMVALLATDVMDFIGIRQAAAYLMGQPLPLPAPVLQEKGMYRLTRHPLYFFSLLALWPVPVMTANLLAFAVCVTLYVVVGSRIEEKRLERLYGQAYVEYRKRVPWLIPRPVERLARNPNEAA